MKSFFSVLALLSILAVVSAAPLEPAAVESPVPAARGLAEIAARKEKEGLGGTLGKEGLGEALGKGGLAAALGKGGLGGTVGAGGLNGMVGKVVGDGGLTGEGKKGKGKKGKKGKKSRDFIELAQPAIATPENARELMDDAEGFVGSHPPVYRRLYPSTLTPTPPIGPI
ncbi:hypothetical protein BU17DRAFT_71171 [Hysterangium stoloniferum]|nr:hypothetical protein BU17DRAFT_71171 [Hysterangium stoloniferum]